MPLTPKQRRTRVVPEVLGLAPPEILRGSGATVYGQIEDWLAEAIGAGRLAPGDRMPAEQDLAAWFGVTRAVGRRGGTFVAERKLEQDRTTLAGFSEQLRRHGMQPGARVLFATQRPAGPVSAAALGLQEGDPVHEVRRVRLGDGRPIVLEQSLVPAAMFPGLLQCRLDGSLYELLETRYGERPHRARESLEPVTAGVREAEALEVAEGAPLMLVERVAYDQAGQPVEFARDLFRGDRTRIVMWTSELAGVF
jgi:GntR family transcriptional regulator